MEGPDGEFYVKQFKSNIEYSFICIDKGSVYETKIAKDKYGNELEILFSPIADESIEVGPFGREKQHTKYRFNDRIFNFAFLLGNNRVVIEEDEEYYVLRDCATFNVLAEYEHPHFDLIWPDNMLFQYDQPFKTSIFYTGNNPYSDVLNFSRDEISYLSHNDIYVYISDHFYTKNGKIPRSNGKLVVPIGTLRFELKSDFDMEETHLRIIENNGVKIDNCPTMFLDYTVRFPEKILKCVDKYIIIPDDMQITNIGNLQLLGNAVNSNVFLLA